jgi:hypothetical protein
MNIDQETLARLRELRKQGVDLNTMVDDSVSPSTQDLGIIKLNSDQERAFNKIRKWLASDEPYFALRGAAGTGKSTLMRHVSELDFNFHFSAPTNKATKVLSQSMGRPAKTTYSLLGARMEAVEEKKELTVSRAPDLGANPVLVIDEAGMVPKILTKLLIRLGYRCLFVGDPAQLNPVGEKLSSAWRLTRDHRVTLHKIERFDNQLLKLATALRKRLKEKHWSSPLRDDNDGTEGVFLKTRKAFERDILSMPLSAWDDTKLCVWRNRTVDEYTTRIREALGFKEDYEVGERILLASPLMEGGSPIAYTDEEFVIHDIHERVISMHGADIETRVFNVDREFVLNVPVDMSKFESHRSKLAAAASVETGSARRAAWSRFWEFSEAFSSTRYGYAMTAHRLQGSTLTSVFLDQSDILANPNKFEAYRAFYVGATRPRKSLTAF